MRLLNICCTEELDGGLSAEGGGPAKVAPHVDVLSQLVLRDPLGCNRFGDFEPAPMTFCCNAGGMPCGLILPRLPVSRTRDIPAGMQSLIVGTSIAVNGTKHNDRRHIHRPLVAWPSRTSPPSVITQLRLHLRRREQLLLQRLRRRRHPARMRRPRSLPLLRLLARRLLVLLRRLVLRLPRRGLLLRRRRRRP